MNKIQQAVAFIQKQYKDNFPKTAIVLGSGLGSLVNELTEKSTFAYREIPNFPRTTVEGHQGNLVIGKLAGEPVILMQGRFHVYEGWDVSDVVLPIRVLAKLGVVNIIVTNAAGGIHSTYKPGDLVAIIDHINMSGRNPLVGENDNSIGPRFPDMSHAYSPLLLEAIETESKKLKVPVQKGVYAWVLGPSYETPAEIRMLRILGADMVGMSTVPEVIAASHAGIRVAGISCITNYAAGLVEQKLSHDDVKEVAELAHEKFTKLLVGAVARINSLE
jgi:purine-nucleoside phosphorylase